VKRWVFFCLEHTASAVLGKGQTELAYILCTFISSCLGARFM
jgi:hypothetical protein